MISRTGRLLFLAACITSLILTPSLRAQTSNGSIAGAIVDKTGGAVVKATVSATSQDFWNNPGKRNYGRFWGYRIDALVPGKYTVSVKASGFSEMKFPNVDVRGSYTTTCERATRSRDGKCHHSGRGVCGPGVTDTVGRFE